jgi:hypothetical protein
MKRILSLSLCLCMVLTAVAESPDSSVVFKAGFLNKELQCYEVSKMLYTLTGKDTSEMERIGFKAEVMVTDSAENAYILCWKIHDYTINTADPNLIKLVRLAVPVEISYRTSKAGVFSEFITGENVTKCLETALPKVLETFRGKSDAETKLASGRIFVLRENLETLILGFMVQFHQFHGLGYNLGEIVDVPVEITSRFSTKPLPAMMRKKLVSLNTVDHTAEIAYATILDTSSYRKALAENLKIAAEIYRSLEQNNIGSLLMEYQTGWPIWSLEQREAKVGTKTYGEQVEIQYKNNQ